MELRMEQQLGHCPYRKLPLAKCRWSQHTTILGEGTEEEAVLLDMLCLRVSTNSCHQPCVSCVRTRKVRRLSIETSIAKRICSACCLMRIYTDMHVRHWAAHVLYTSILTSTSLTCSPRILTSWEMGPMSKVLCETCDRAWPRRFKSFRPPISGSSDSRLGGEDEKEDEAELKDYLDRFLESHTGSEPSVVADEIRRCCQGLVDWLMLDRGVEPHPHRSAWVHEMIVNVRGTICNIAASWCESGLTPVGFRSCLKKQLKPETKNQGYQRRIYIRDLDKFHICALVLSAGELEREVLPEVLYRHLTPSASLNVFPTRVDFRLSFDIPFVKLVHWKPTHAPPKDMWEYGELTFLNLRPGSGERSGLQRGQFSCVVYGHDRVQHSTLFLVRGSDEDYFGPDEDYAPTLLPPDPIPTYLLSSAPLEPRKSFITALEIRSRLALKHWESLVLLLKRKVENFENNDLERQTGQYLDDERKKEWIKSMVNKISPLQYDLGRIASAWDTFSGGGGQIRYFGSPDYEDHLSVVRYNYARLKDCLTTLRFVKERCDVCDDELEGRMKKRKMYSQEKLGFVSLLTVWFLPLVATAGLFSMKDGVFPFEMNTRSFFLTGAVLSGAIAFFNYVVPFQNWSKYYEWAIGIISPKVAVQSKATFDAIDTTYDARGPSLPR